MKAMGLPPQREGEMNRQYRYNENERQYSQGETNSLADKILNGTATATEEEEYYNLGGTDRKLREAEKARETPLIERQQRHLPKWLRQQEWPGGS